MAEGKRVVIKGVYHPLYAELLEIVAPKNCSEEDFVRITYIKDSSTAPSQVRGIVVRPRGINK